MTFWETVEAVVLGMGLFHVIGFVGAKIIGIAIADAIFKKQNGG